MPPQTVRWLKEQVYFLIVLVFLTAGFVYLVIGTGHWRRATFVMGCAMLLAAGFRAVLPTVRAGLLSVRGKWTDTVMYVVLGGLVLALDIRLHR